MAKVLQKGIFHSHRERLVSDPPQPGMEARQLKARCTHWSYFHTWYTMLIWNAQAGQGLVLVILQFCVRTELSIPAAPSRDAPAPTTQNLQPDEAFYFHLTIVCVVRLNPAERIVIDLQAIGRHCITLQVYVLPSIAWVGSLLLQSWLRLS